MQGTMRAGNEKHPAANQRIVEFIQNNRKPIYIAAAVLALALVGSVVALILADVFRGRAIAAVEDLGARYEALRGSIAWGDDEDGEIALLLADLRAFAPRNSGYAGGRAWSMVARIYWEKGEWAEAEAAWLSSASASPRSYMAPLAFFGAAAAAEEQGSLRRAIEHYERSISAPAGFFAAPRAQFNIGRIFEALGEYHAALAAYHDVIFRWPHDITWSNLARSAIIALETQDWRLHDPVVRPDPLAFDFGDGWFFPDFADYYYY